MCGKKKYKKMLSPGLRGGATCLLLCVASFYTGTQVSSCGQQPKARGVPRCDPCPRPDVHPAAAATTAVAAVPRATPLARLREAAADAAPPRAAAGAAATPVASVAGVAALGAIGEALGSDKVLVHQYHVPYALHLDGMRAATQGGAGRGLKVLEIGLGCLGLRDIGLGVALWGRYLPDAERLDVVEYDRPCAERFVAERRDGGARKGWGPRGGEGVAVHVGDQSNVTFLRELGETHGPWDLIVDDGSHQSAHQMASYKALLPYVRSGGKYAIEDLQTSFFAGSWGGEGTAYHWIGTEVMRSVQTRRKQGKENESIDTKLRSTLRSVDCHHFVCIMTKR